MSEFLTEELRAGLSQARQEKSRRRRLQVRIGDQSFTILRHWQGGFALPAEDAPRLRGLVDIYDGARHHAQCLIVATGEEAGERIYEFKRSTPAMDRPPADYAEDPAD